MAGALDAYVNDIIRDASLRGRSTVSLALEAVNFAATKIHHATLVRIAEAAVDYERPDDAQRALDEFFDRKPIHDQHHVRALFASAELQALRAAAFGGHNRLQLVLSAIDTLLRGLAIAEKGGSAGDAPSYRFLVYNGSVHHWNIVRPLLRMGYRRHAVSSLTRVAEALAAADDADLSWRVRHHLMVALCSAEASAEDRASAAAVAGGSDPHVKATLAALAAAWDLAGRVVRASPLDSSAARLVEDVVRLATHLGLSAPPKDKEGAAAGGGGGAEPSSASKGGKSSSLGGSATGGAFTSAQLSGTVAALTNADARSRVTATLQALWTATAVGIASQEPSDAEHAATDPTSLLSRVRRTRGSPDVRARLLDLLQVGKGGGGCVATADRWAPPRPAAGGWVGTAAPHWHRDGCTITRQPGSPALLVRLPRRC